jgi:hypothetical protein
MQPGTLTLTASIPEQLKRYLQTCCSRRIRAMRAEYHPDRYAELGPAIASVAAEVSAIVNTRTEPLLEEDRQATDAAPQR